MSAGMHTLRGTEMGGGVQFELEATVSKTLACMSEITIDMDSGSCSMRAVAAEPRCEFPVVPDRLVGARSTRLPKDCSYGENSRR